MHWLRVLDTPERSQVHQRIRQQLHPIVPLLPSAMSIFNFRVEGLEFGACVVDFELPIDPALLRVSGG
jgi:hypothetical protein